MAKCVHCNLNIRFPCREDGATRNGLVVYVAGDWELRRIAYLQRLARAYKRRGIPRRKTPDWLAGTIFCYQGRIFAPNGKPYCTPDTLIDDAFRGRDATRWLSDLKTFAMRRPTQRPQWKTLPRLRLIDLAMKIERLSPKPSSASL